MPQDLAKEAADRGIAYFLIGFVDLFGVPLAKLVPAGAIAAMQRDGAAFAGFATHLDLTPADADAFLRQLGEAKFDDETMSLSSWFNELVYPLFVQACYADPIYRGNKDKVFWQMIGYPGLPATHTRDMVQFRGKPYPGAVHPKSILDFS